MDGDAGVCVKSSAIAVPSAGWGPHVYGDCFAGDFPFLVNQRQLYSMLIWYIESPRIAKSRIE